MIKEYIIKLTIIFCLKNKIVSIENKKKIKNKK
jgi:hypothetical protein